ncbi:MAG: fatty acid desaturase family protein [Pseudomonadota bacterium]
MSSYQSRKSFFSADEIAHYARRSDFMGALMIAHCWALIFGAMALFIWWPNPLTFILAVMLIGSRQLGLAILMHDAAHSALFKSRRLNEFAGEYLCGRPVFAELHAYRRYHLQHHKHTQTEQDPDLVLSKPFPTTRSSLWRKIVRDLTGQTGFKLRKQQLLSWYRLAGDKDAMDEAKLSQSFADPGLGKSLIINAILFASLALVGYWWLYPALWLLPLLTWYQLVVRLRNIAEHGAVEFSDNPLKNVRTTLAGPLMRLFVAPYYVNYHLEHHLIMHVPCWQLPKLHRLMIERGYAPEMEIGQSYFDVLRLASSKSA